MKHLLIILISILLLQGCANKQYPSEVGQSLKIENVRQTPSEVGQSERPETIIIPVSSLGDVSEVRKQILQNTLTDELKKHFRIVPQEKYQQVLEQVFEELEYEECTEDQCIMRVQEMLQVENVFNLQIIGEGKDSQLNLKWITLDEKKNEEDYCRGCGTFELRKMIGGLVEKLVGEKVFEKPVVLEKKVEPEPEVVVVRNNDFTLKEKYESCKGNNICLRKVAKTQSINIFSLKRMARVNGWNGFVPTVGESSTLIHPKGFPKQTESTPTGTVIDSSTGLMWQKKPDGVERNWKDAKLYCQKLTLGGYSDWRLPNESVLMKMIENKMMFANSLRNHWYWSSTVSTDRPHGATYVDFGYGDTGWSWKGSGLYVRCVRGGS